MYFKLSSRNVKRSLRDYTIYFLTLTFAVAIFYVFNSISSQQAMLDLSEMQLNFLDILSKFISVVSIFVSFILGFLIIYANKFIIRKRKKEFGLYMSLGMSRRKISFTLFCETLLIGAMALVTGLLFGVVVSQGLAAVTAKLFVADLSEYKFVFSSEAMIKTIIYFGIMFLLVIIFNSFAISKYKLIDLINASKKNQELKVKNIYVSLIIFLLSVISLGAAYHLIMVNRLAVIDTRFNASIILGIIGTFLFFMSLSGFALKLVQAKKNFYLKNLNMFILRQLNGKVNTTFVSMSLICLMLFFTICILSTGLSIKDALQKEMDLSTPYDATIAYKLPISENRTLTKMLKEKGLDLNNYGKEHIEYLEYKTEVIFKTLIKDTTDKSIQSKYNTLIDFEVPVIRISDFNRLMKMQGEKEIKLKDDQILFLSNFNVVQQSLNEYIRNNNCININGMNFNMSSDTIIYKTIETLPMCNNTLTFILPDYAVKGLTAQRSIINLNYNGDKNEVEKAFENKSIELMDNMKKNGGYDFNLRLATKVECFDTNNGLSTTILYIGIYIGLVFLIASAAVLALQQLSEATENINRYETLKKIGVDKRMRNKSIFLQVLIYFMMPLSLAIVHSIVGINVANEVVTIFGGANIIGSSILTASMICLIYGGYFFATYLGYKNIIENK